MTVPGYYKNFKCLCGDCRHNCCEGGWEIEIDEKSLERFRNIEGELGTKIRSSVTADGTFVQCGGKCPMLTENGLCEMVCNGVQQCVVCDEYPRFTEYYDRCRTERGLSLSCEAAADLIIHNKNKLTFEGEESDSDNELFNFLLWVRAETFELATDRNTPLHTRLSLALDFCEKMQDKINRGDYTREKYTPNDEKYRHKNLCEYTEILQGLEILSEEWSDILKEVKNREPAVHNIDSVEYEQLTVYFIYRYMLKAVYDYDVLTKMKFAVLSVYMIAAAAEVCGDITEAARIYSVEIEHNEENTAEIFDEIIFGLEI